MIVSENEISISWNKADLVPKVPNKINRIFFKNYTKRITEKIGYRMSL